MPQLLVERAAPNVNGKTHVGRSVGCNNVRIMVAATVQPVCVRDCIPHNTDSFISFIHACRPKAASTEPTSQLAVELSK